MAEPDTAAVRAAVLFVAGSLDSGAVYLRGDLGAAAAVGGLGFVGPAARVATGRGLSADAFGLRVALAIISVAAVLVLCLVAALPRGPGLR